MAVPPPSSPPLPSTPAPQHTPAAFTTSTAHAVPTTPSPTPAVQRAATSPTKPVPLRLPASLSSSLPADAGGRAALPVAPLSAPPAAASSGGSAQPVVQRLWGRSKKAAKPPVRHSATGALAAAAAATVASTVGTPLPAVRHEAAPPAYTPTAEGPPSHDPPSYAQAANGSAPPEYTAVPAGGFDPRELTDFQLDELVHRIIGRITRLIRTELRLDRERIGRLRDPRH